eukprot:SAG31_NODE_1803_length_7238_cov_3.273988_2_plen_751_part_00
MHGLDSSAGDDSTVGSSNNTFSSALDDASNLLANLLSANSPAPLAPTPAPSTPPSAAPTALSETAADAAPDAAAALSPALSRFAQLGRQQRSADKGGPPVNSALARPQLVKATHEQIEAELNQDQSKLNNVRDSSTRSQMPLTNAEVKIMRESPHAKGVQKSLRQMLKVSWNQLQEPLADTPAADTSGGKSLKERALELQSTRNNGARRHRPSFLTARSSPVKSTKPRPAFARTPAQNLDALALPSASEQDAAFAHGDKDSTGTLSLQHLRSAVSFLWSDYDDMPGLARAFRAADVAGANQLNRQQFSHVIEYIQHFHTLWAGGSPPPPARPRGRGLPGTQSSPEKRQQPKPLRSKADPARGSKPKPSTYSRAHRMREARNAKFRKEELVDQTIVAGSGSEISTEMLSGPSTPRPLSTSHSVPNKSVPPPSPETSPRTVTPTGESVGKNSKVSAECSTGASKRLLERARQLAAARRQRAVSSPAKLDNQMDSLPDDDVDASPTDSPDSGDQSSLLSIASSSSSPARLRLSEALKRSVLEQATETDEIHIQTSPISTTFVASRTDADGSPATSPVLTVESSYFLHQNSDGPKSPSSFSFSSPSTLEQSGYSSGSCEEAIAAFWSKRASFRSLPGTAATNTNESDNDGAACSDSIPASASGLLLQRPHKSSPVTRLTLARSIELDRALPKTGEIGTSIPTALESVIERSAERARLPSSMEVLTPARRKLERERKNSESALKAMEELAQRSQL